MRKALASTLLPTLLLFSCWGGGESSSSYSKSSIPEPPYSYLNLDFSASVKAIGEFEGTPFDATVTLGESKASFVSDYPPKSTGDFFDETYYKALCMAGKVDLSSAQTSFSYGDESYNGEADPASLLLYTKDGDLFLDTRDLAPKEDLPFDILIGQYAFRGFFDGLSENIPEDVKALDFPLEDIAGTLESVVWNDEAADCLSLEILDKENFVISLPLTPESIVTLADALSAEPYSEEQKSELLQNLQAYQVPGVESWAKVIYDAKEKRLAKTEFDVHFKAEGGIYESTESQLRVDAAEIWVKGELSWGKQETMDVPDYNEFKEVG